MCSDLSSSTTANHTTTWAPNLNIDRSLLSRVCKTLSWISWRACTCTSITLLKWRRILRRFLFISYVWRAETDVLYLRRCDAFGGCFLFLYRCLLLAEDICTVFVSFLSFFFCSQTVSGIYRQGFRLVCLFRDGLCNLLLKRMLPIELQLFPSRSPFFFFIGSAWWDWAGKKVVNSPMRRKGVTRWRWIPVDGLWIIG